MGVLYERTFPALVALDRVLGKDEGRKQLWPDGRLHLLPDLSVTSPGSSPGSPGGFGPGSRFGRKTGPISCYGRGREDPGSGRLIPCL